MDSVHTQIIALHTKVDALYQLVNQLSQTLANGSDASIRPQLSQKRFNGESPSQESVGGSILDGYEESPSSLSKMSARALLKTRNIHQAPSYLDDSDMDELDDEWDESANEWSTEVDDPTPDEMDEEEQRRNASYQASIMDDFSELIDQKGEVIDHRDIVPEFGYHADYLGLEPSCAADIQVQRLTAQLTAAYNRIAALEEQLLAKRIF